jgi:ribonuclease T1
MSNSSARSLRGLLLALLATLVVFTSVAACVAAPGGKVQAGQGAALATRKPTATRTPARVTATRAPSKKATATSTPKRRATATPQAGVRATRTPDDGLPTIAFDRLPKEARETIRLIRKGGPFPYDKDGSTFSNREGLLPKRPNGYYKEYTVITPGSSDRGARRIVAGREGELYYTGDHYDSFKRVIE